MKDIVQVIYEIEQSNVPDIWQVKSWVINSQMLILKYHNYYKDWLQAKSLVDTKIADVVNDWFNRVDDSWSDLEKYRNEIISHAFGTPINQSHTKKQSIFSLGTWVTYEIPISDIDYINLYHHIQNITMFLKGQFPLNWYEFEHNLFPSFPIGNQ